MSTDLPGASPVDRVVMPASEARWYCVSKNGRATLCADQADALAEVERDTADWPLHAPYRAVQLVDAAEVERFLEAATRYYVIRQDHEGAVLPELALYAGRALDDYIDAAIVSMGELGPNAKAERPATAAKEQIDGTN